MKYKSQVSKLNEEAANTTNTILRSVQNNSISKSEMIAGLKELNSRLEKISQFIELEDQSMSVK